MEIDGEHPLLLFPCPIPEQGGGAGHAEKVVAIWQSCPANVRDYACLSVGGPGRDATVQALWLQELFGVLQLAEIPTVLRLYPAESPMDPAQLEALLRSFTFIRGVELRGLRFNTYPTNRFGQMALEAQHQELRSIVETAARYGRFVYWPMAELDWVRLGANTASAPFLESLRPYAGYLFPAAHVTDRHVLPNMMATLGLWLEDRVAGWGVEAGSAWYGNVGFAGLGKLGRGPAAGFMPNGLYRSMILNGAMTGASVYAFDAPQDLWFGAAHHYWDEAIFPTLDELLTRNLIPGKDSVKREARVAYQVRASATPQDFHLNLRDLDLELDQGNLLRALLTTNRPVRGPELMLNRSDWFWTPILTGAATEGVLSQFEAVLEPGTVNDTPGFQALLEQYRLPTGQGTAFIATVGTGVFIQHTLENEDEAQSYRIDAMPAPVRQIGARREGNNVELTWPFRDGDVAWKLYKRVLPSTRFALVAQNSDERRFVDVLENPDQTVAYAVTALTDAKEVMEGAVRYGESLMMSANESRIAEEVLLTPVLSVAVSAPLSSLAMPVAPAPGPGGLEGITDDVLKLTEAIAERLRFMQSAFEQEDLNGLMDLYATEYADPQGWQFQYVRRAFQWYFERYGATKMDYQVLDWDFTALATEQRIRTRLYLNLRGYGVSDATGAVADVPVYIPRNESGEVWAAWIQRDGVWRLETTNPAMPNFRDLLSFSAGPHDNFPLGPDLHE
ncbi:MAG: hypothetical protein HYV27_06220 [Candidatus Hydrogenedentes bacterium]|nr:hypothetical protein [Candidatus Hydrogenedentota bacterium]